MSPARFRTEFRERLLGLHWRHWSALGVQSQLEPEDRWLVDIEALAASTRAVAAEDLRLAGVAEQWLELNRAWVHQSRLTRLTRLLAGWPPAARGLTAKAVRLRAVAPSVRRPALRQLWLRAVFGTDARSDILLHLHYNGPGSSRATGLAVGWDQTTVYRVLERWVAAGLASRDHKGYRLTPAAGALFAPSDDAPRYLNWIQAFSTFDRILAGPRARTHEAYSWASLLRDLMPDLAALAAAVSIALPDSVLYPGDRFFEPCARALLRFLAILLGR